MRKLWFLSLLLLPALALSQEAPPGASLPTSAPTSLPASAPTSAASLPTSLLSGSMAPAPKSFHRYPMLAYRLSLYPTLVGYGGALTFATVGFLNENKGLRPLWLSFGALGLLGPSIGHLYSGEYFRGARLLARRTVVPGALALSGLGLVLLSGGITAFSGFDGQKDGVSRPALLGLLIGSAVLSYSIPSISIMSGRHIRDAKKAPTREAKERKLPAPPSNRPKKP
jgi:hypothetical protein